MNSKYSLLSFLLGAILIITSCGKDDPVIPDEEELITTLRYTLTPSDGGTPIQLSFVDLDGDGGDDPTIVGGTLKANETYSGVMILLNESESPSENITAEVSEEDTDHQFFFQTTVTGLSVVYADQDSDGNPLGLESTLTTGEAASGTLTVTLRHQPNKDAAGVSDGNIAEAGGETDIEVIFPINVE